MAQLRCPRALSYYNFDYEGEQHPYDLDRAAGSISGLSFLSSSGTLLWIQAEQLFDFEENSP